MKRAMMKDGLLFSTLVVVFAALVTASCGATHKTPVHNPVNDPGYGGMSDPGYGPASGPVPTAAASTPSQPSYQQTVVQSSTPPVFDGYDESKLRLPKRYGYIDATTCPPKPMAPRK